MSINFGAKEVLYDSSSFEKNVSQNWLHKKYAPYYVQNYFFCFWPLFFYPTLLLAHSFVRRCGSGLDDGNAKNFVF